MVTCVNDIAALLGQPAVDVRVVTIWAVHLRSQQASYVGWGGTAQQVPGEGLPARRRK